MPRRATGTYKFKKRDGTIGIGLDPYDMRPISRMTWTVRDEFLATTDEDIRQHHILIDCSPFYLTSVRATRHSKALMTFVGNDCLMRTVDWYHDIWRWKRIFYSPDDPQCVDFLLNGPKHG